MQPPTDEALLEAWKAGSPEAFELLFERYRGRVVSYAWRMVGRREEAEEICVDAFCKVLEGAWRPTGTFRSFLFTVVHRDCLMRLRSRRRRGRLLQLFGRHEDAAPTPEHHLLDDERARQLADAVATLSPDHRAVLLLFYAQELPSAEVATIVGCSDQQVRSQLSYARKKLRAVLEPE